MQVSSKLDPADKEKLEKEIEDAIKWLDDNQLAEVDAAFTAPTLCRLVPCVCAFPSISKLLSAAARHVEVTDAREQDSC